MDRRKLFIWIALMAGGGGGGEILTVTGVSPLYLYNAISHAILSLAQTGKCEHRSASFPAGYTQLDYVETSGDIHEVIDLGFKLNQDDDVDIAFNLKTVQSPFAFGSHTSNNANTFTVRFSPTNKPIASFNSNTYAAQYGTAATVGSDYRFTINKTARRIYENGTLVAENTTLFEGEFETPQNALLFYVGGGSVNYSFACKLYYLKVAGKLDLVPAKRNSDNVVGLYNLIDGTFYLPYSEQGTLTAGPATAPTPSNPMPIWCNNGEIKYSANIANVNSSTASVGYYISSTGVVTADSNNWFYQAYIPVQPNTTYTLSFDTNVYYVTISEYSTAEDSGFIIRKNGATGSNTQLTITTEATTNYIRFGTNINRDVVTMDAVLAIHWMLAKSATVVPYAPYVAPNGGIYVDGTAEVLTITDADSNTQTASVVDLLAVGSAADTQEIVGGDVDRIITKFRATSDMNWLLASGTGYKQFYTAATQGVLSNSKSCMSNIAPYGCTASNRASYSYGCYTGSTGNLCFQMIGATTIETVDDWKDFLDANIVYVVAELATATAESVAPQSLSTAEWGNTISVVSNVGNVTLECEYKGKEA